MMKDKEGAQGSADASLNRKTEYEKPKLQKRGALASITAVPVTTTWVVVLP